MAGSLRDQLVQSGLATSQQAKKAEREANAEKRRGTTPVAAPEGKKHRKARPAAGPDSKEQVIARARQQQAEKAERDRALAQIANEKAAAKARRAEIRQIIQQNDQRTHIARDDDVPYNFVHGKKIKRIYVPRAHQVELGNGNLVIVNDDGKYHLVSKAVAEQIRTRDPKRIIAAHDQQAAEPGPDDEYYAKFKVPDDLDW